MKTFLKVGCLYVPFALGAIMVAVGFFMTNNAMLVIGALIMAFMAIPTKYDPAIRLKERNERAAGRW